MSLSYIWIYCARALKFAVPAALLCALVYEIVRRRRGKPLAAGHFLCSVLFAGYLAALVQIIAIRNWQDFFDLTRTNTETEIIWIPLKTTIRDAREMGILWELYHMLGNIAWFLPLGFLGAELLPKLRTWRVLPLAALGFSFFLEFSQWFFQTGVSDVDDLILNTAGACVGFWLWGLWRKRRKINERLVVHHDKTE